ncbi:MAG: hypothetical protein IPM48_06000 [Saprospiraceae bacterium]|nr:hypothetical protein [Saprospiraceae bacterium]
MDGSGLISFDGSGNVNWCRRFYLPKKFNADGLYFFDALQLPNINIVVSGDYYTYDQWQQLDNDTYLIGLDSLGCPFLGCTDADSVYVYNIRMISDLEEHKNKEVFSYSLDEQQNTLTIKFDQKVSKPEV